MDFFKSRKHQITVVAAVVLILSWLAIPENVKASQSYFPFITDDWIVCDIQMPTVKTVPEIKEKNNSELKSQKKKNKKAENSLSTKEKEMLYKVVSLECDTGYEGSLAVISCMLNRKDSERYPDDLMEVVREDSQFTAYYDKSSGTYPYKNREPSKECIAAVDDALEKGKRNIPSYILYFRSSDYDYLSGYETYGTIGDNTYFYLETDR